MLIPFGLGLLAGTGQAPLGLWYLTILAMAVWLLRQPETRRAAFKHGWLFGAGYFAVALHWIVSPFLVDIGSTGWMAPFAVVLMAGGAAVFWGGAAYAAYRVAPRSTALRALAIGGAEALRSYLFTGFPWGLLGHIWIDTPFSQLAAFGGPHFLTLITVVLAFACVLIWKRIWMALIIPIGAADGENRRADGPTCSAQCAAIGKMGSGQKPRCL